MNESNLDNIKELAKVAYEGENWKQGHEYYSKLLERDLTNAEHWLRLGICAAGLNDAEGSRVAEVKTLIFRALTMALEETVKSEAAGRLRQAFHSMTRRIDESVFDNVKQYQRVSMPDNGSALLHMAGQSINKANALLGAASSRLCSIELLEVECALVPSAQNYAFAVARVEALFEHSRSNGHYLKDPALSGAVAKVLHFHSKAEGVVRSAEGQSGITQATKITPAAGSSSQSALGQMLGVVGLMGGVFLVLYLVVVVIRVVRELSGH